jgi:hypothetical protein
MCGVFGIGGRRDRDRAALRRIFEHLEPGGALLIANHWFPYGEWSDTQWARWLRGHREDIPREWPAEGERRKTADGDELELMSRLLNLDPLEQVYESQVRMRLWSKGKVVKEEEHSLKENLYFAQEVLLLLEDAGFRDVVVEGGYTGKPATPDDGMVCFVARKPA